MKSYILTINTTHLLKHYTKYVLSMSPQILITYLFVKTIASELFSPASS